MKQLFLILLVILLLGIHSTIAQSKEVIFLIEECIKMMKNKSVNSKSINWTTLKKKALIKATGINNPNKLGPVMRYLFESINDFHGAFFYKDSTFKWSSNEPVVSDSIRNEWNKGVYVKTEILENNIGYLRIPSMPFSSREDGNNKAQNLNDSLCFLLEKNIKGIILDLRLNGGGAMHPMILGVEQLLGQGPIGSFHGKKQAGWFLKDNSFIVDTTAITNIFPRCNINAEHIPVVMLISPVTGSSAEFFIIAFIGREKTILLGSQTAGYVTVVGGFPINKDAYMYLSVGYGADRKGKIYKEAIKPDIPFTSVDKFNDIKNDEKVKSAVDWLKSHF